MKHQLRPPVEQSALPNWYVRRVVIQLDRVGRFAAALALAGCGVAARCVLAAEPAGAEYSVSAHVGIARIEVALTSDLPPLLVGDTLREVALAGEAGGAEEYAAIEWRVVMADVDAVICARAMPGARPLPAVGARMRKVAGAHRARRWELTMEGFFFTGAMTGSYHSHSSYDTTCNFGTVTVTNESTSDQQASESAPIGTSIRILHRGRRVIGGFGATFEWADDRAVSEWSNTYADYSTCEPRSSGYRSEYHRRGEYAATQLFGGFAVAGRADRGPSISLMGELRSFIIPTGLTAHLMGSLPLGGPTGAVLVGEASYGMDVIRINFRRSYGPPTRTLVRAVVGARYPAEGMYFVELMAGASYVSPTTPFANAGLFYGWWYQNAAGAPGVAAVLRAGLRW